MNESDIRRSLSSYLDKVIKTEINEVVFGYDRPPPPVYSINEHHISRLIIPLAGEQEIFYAAHNAVKTRKLRPGDVFFSVKNGWAWITREGQGIPFEIISVVFTPRYTRVIHVENDSSPILGTPDLFYHIPRSENIAPFLIQALNRIAFRPEERFEQIVSLLLALLYDIRLELNSVSVKTISKSEKTFNLVADYLGEHCHLPINRETVSEALHLNASYLSRLFQSKTGEKFSSYLNKLRLNRALYLLRHSSENISSIAGSCGYSSTGYFIKSFKALYKITPAGYRLRSDEIITPSGAVRSKSDPEQPPAPTVQ